MKRAHFLRASAGSLAMSSLFAPLPGRSQTPRALKIGYVPSSLFAPLFIAIDRGYLGAGGFEPQASPILAGQDSVTLLSMGTLDIAAGGISAAFFNAISRGLDVRYVASLAYQPKNPAASALVVREDLMNDGSVKRPRDLRGRSIAWIGGMGATSTYYVERILRTDGLSLKDVRVVNLDLASSATALANRAVDGVFASTPLLEELEERKLGRQLAAAPPGISLTGLFFGVNLLKNRSEATSVLRAVRRSAPDLTGEAYTSAPTVDTLAKYTKLPAQTLRRSARYAVDREMRVDTKSLLDCQRLFLDLGLLSYKSPLPLSSLTASF
jgi:NitT/TauT family transport system substrate-binding protein